MSDKRIERVAVLGAGVMGSGIAAHLAGAGIPVLMLDIVPPDLSEEEKKDPVARNRFAHSGLEKALKAKPAAFYSKRFAELIEIGNFEDDLEKIKECDWVIEGVIERLDIKRSLFEKLLPHLAPHAAITSNTSGLTIQSMIEGFSEDFRKRFFITHFFNPVRYMKLLEFVTHDQTDPALVESLARFCKARLGKGIVYGKDTPNFIANRIGIFSMMYAIQVMIEDGYTIDEVDAIAGKPMGRPKSAAFRTADMVGLDTIVHVTNNCYENLPHDEMHDVFKVPDFILKMVEKGWLGQKAKQGFYQRTKDKKILTLDWKTMEYKPREKPSFGSIKKAKSRDAGEGIKKLVSGDDRAATFAWKVTARSLAYAAQRLGEIADDVVNIDRAMRWGFNWALGPFEVWDAMGVKETAERMEKDGIELPASLLGLIKEGKLTSFYKREKAQTLYFDPLQKKDYVPLGEDPRSLDLTLWKQDDSNRIIDSNDGASLIDLGDGVACLEFHTKMNALDLDIIEMANKAVDYVEEHDWNGLVVGNSADNFSAGANIMLVLMQVMNEDNPNRFEEVKEALKKFQGMTQRFQYCSKPVVAAPAGLTLGGGAESAMGADAIQAHAELYMGLVEVGIGLIPAAGGCMMLLKRLMGNTPDEPSYDATPIIGRAFMTVGMGKVATSAEEAREMGFLDPRDLITLNREYHLSDAKGLVLGLAHAGYRPPLPKKFRLPGKSAAATIEMLLYSMREGHQISPHDMLIGKTLAGVLCGGDATPRTPVSEEYLLELEREAFASLSGELKTVERMQHMLQTGKPLRN